MRESFVHGVLRQLTEGEVEFLVVGGLSAVLQGAPIVTEDLDICYRRTRENVERLARVLLPMRPALRTRDGPIPFPLDARVLWNGCNFTLTAGGEDLDVLGVMDGIGGYDDVIGRALVVSLGDLEDLIATKRAVGRKKDLAVLPLLEELSRRRDESPNGGGDSGRVDAE